MFLDAIRRRNPRLIEQAIALHQAGRIPANTYVIDLDAAEANARAIATEAKRLGLKVFAMTKQMGRNGDFCRAVKSGGIGDSVCVDMECARATHRAGMAIGHVGHLVQIPKAEADAAASFAPGYWTVFNAEKASEAAAAAKKRGTRPAAAGAYPGRRATATIAATKAASRPRDVVAVADRIDELDGAAFAGITTFPALLFDQETRKIAPTPNLATLHRAAEVLSRSGRREIEINAPGTTSSAVLAALADAGATQVEPGHGLTGTTPLHAVEDLPELPAVVYVSEVSHIHGGDAYLLRRRALYRPGLPRLLGQGHRLARAHRSLRRAPYGRDPPSVQPSTITA